jgi:hypothetical protein
MDAALIASAQRVKHYEIYLFEESGLFFSMPVSTA